MAISLYAEKSGWHLPSVLSKMSETSATLEAGRESEPAKITSSIALPRSERALCSPIAQRIESRIFDFPHPFGPTTAVTC